MVKELLSCTNNLILFQAENQKESLESDTLIVTISDRGVCKWFCTDPEMMGKRNRWGDRSKGRDFENWLKKQLQIEEIDPRNLNDKVCCLCCSGFHLLC
jgi:hypothetical protein